MLRPTDRDRQAAAVLGGTLAQPAYQQTDTQMAGGRRPDRRAGGLEGKKIIVELACDGRGPGTQLGRARVAYLGGRITPLLGLEV